MSYAIIRIGGKQFKVSKGDTFKLEKQDSAKVEVLLFSDEGELYIGAPVVNGQEVKISKVEDKRDKKIRVGRFKAKSRYRRVRGHKQEISVFKVDSIGKKFGKTKNAEKAEKEVSETKKPVKRGRPASTAPAGANASTDKPVFAKETKEKKVSSKKKGK